MSNSPLLSHTRISANKNSPRNAKIDTISIHCVAGNCTVETLGNLFAPSSFQASSNYGIGTDGRIGMYVEEKDRSWCTSSGPNDHRAITIEVSNDSGAPQWHVSDAAMESLINLCVDICKRNGIKKLLWQGDKNLIGQVDKQNMTVHRWFAAKACPGDYLYSKHPYIANEVNKRLGVASAPVAENKPKPPVAPSKPAEAVKPVANSFLAKVNTAALNVREGPGVDTKVTKVLMNDKNIYTIVEVAKGPGATEWWKLKSGLGWVSSDYMVKYK